MKKSLLILLIVISFSSCKSSKSAKRKKSTPDRVEIKTDTEVATDYYIEPKETVEKRSKKTPPTESKAEQIIDYALEFEGTRYKWGGTTKSGMDCSGLVFESFRTHDILLPRISRDMAKKGTKIPLKKVTQGDLLFFKTGGRRNSINHVGLIVAIRNNDIEFIHATSSKGVIISHLNESYWQNAFEEARRIL
ncbi:C40 family peptidase [Tamlana sp. s12]|uniref:C40 family peptidase n=1 Tax=Flavobacteriaceae TaxID=49546 RepID=UPI0007FC31DE|nr:MULTISPECIES: C40 family peptidase [Tamlana]OBQ54767.1 hypothetical protein VQ01_11540 [Tamlana sp. s12]QQY82259.1 C40 family peptidase [Tamlana sp. s12]